MSGNMTGYDESRMKETGDADLASYFTLVIDRTTQYYKLLLALLFVFSILVVAYTHAARPLYAAVAAITPPIESLSDADTGAGGRISSLTWRLGLGGQQSGSFEIFDQFARILRSYRLAAALSHNSKFVESAFPKTWDPQSKTLRTGDGFSLARTVKGVLGLPTTQMAAEDRIYLFLNQSLSLSIPQVATTNISEISLRSDDPGRAQELLALILNEADLLMRQDKRQDLVARINYLQNQLSKTTLEDQRNAIITLLAVQQNSMMTIAADRYYAFSMVEQPHAPAKPIWPRLSSMVGMILFLSFTSWIVAIFTFSAHSWLLRTFSKGAVLFPWFGRARDAIRFKITGRKASEPVGY